MAATVRLASAPPRPSRWPASPCEPTYSPVATLGQLQRSLLVVARLRIGHGAPVAPAPFVIRWALTRQVVYYVTLIAAPYADTKARR
jgi:hypothetical protein